MSPGRQEGPSQLDIWRVGLQLVLAASATALISDASAPVVISVAMGSIIVFGVVSFARRRNRSLATVLVALAGRRRFAFASSVVTVLLLVLAAYLLGIRKHDDADSNAASRVLLRLIVSDLRQSCRPIDDSTAVAALECSDRASGVRVRFFQYTNAKAMNHSMDNLVAASSAPPGRCFTQAVAISSYSLGGEHAGRLWCDALSRRQHLAWTNDELFILARADQTSSEGNSLMQWWTDAGTGVSANGLRQPFPDEYERRLLEHVPEAFRARCKRDGFSLPGSKAALRCDPQRGADSAYYLLFDDRKDLSQRVRDRQGELKDLKGSCSIGRDEPAVAQYRDGMRFCFDEENVSWVEWSDDDLLVYAYARREPSNLPQLFGWWRHNAGPN